MSDLDEINEKLDTILNNHLHHMEKDINDLNTKQIVIETRLDSIEDFLRQNFNRVIIGLLAIAGAAVGVDMVGAM
jgi:hypothetical protein